MSETVTTGDELADEIEAMETTEETNDPEETGDTHAEESAETTAEDQTASEDATTEASGETEEPITDEELTAPRELVAGFGEMRTLHTPLSMYRHDQLSDELVEKTLALEAEREKKKAADAVFNGKIKALELRCQALAATLDEGSEEGPVQCRWFSDFTNGMRYLKRLDTFEVIDSQPLSWDERQRRIEFEEERAEREHAESASADEEPVDEAPVKQWNHIRCNVCSWTQQVEPMSELPTDATCVSCGSRAVSFWGDGVIAEPVDHIQPGASRVGNTDSPEYNLGAASYQRGAKLEENPYTEDEPSKRDEWANGWRDESKCVEDERAEEAAMEGENNE